MVGSSVLRGIRCLGRKSPKLLIERGSKIIDSVHDPCCCAGRRWLAVVRLSALRVLFSCNVRQNFLKPSALLLLSPRAPSFPRTFDIKKSFSNLPATPIATKPTEPRVSARLSRVNTALFRPKSITTQLKRLQEGCRRKDAGRADTAKLHTEVQDWAALPTGLVHLRRRMPYHRGNDKR